VCALIIRLPQTGLVFCFPADKFLAHLFLYSIRCEVLTELKMSMLVFCVVTPCRLVGTVNTNVSEDHNASIFRASYLFLVIGSLEVNLSSSGTARSHARLFSMSNALRM
jgi:hypothetical protein